MLSLANATVRLKWNALTGSTERPSRKFPVQTHELFMHLWSELLTDANDHNRPVKVDPKEIHSKKTSNKPKEDTGKRARWPLHSWENGESVDSIV